MNGRILPGDAHEHTTLGRLFHGFIHPALKSQPAVDAALIDSAPARAAALQASVVLVIAALLDFALAAFTLSTAAVANGVGLLAAATSVIPLAVAVSPTTQQTSKVFTYGRDRAEDLLWLLAIVALAFVTLSVLVVALVRAAFFIGGTDPVLVGAAGIIGLIASAVAGYFRLTAARGSKSPALAGEGRALGWNALSSVIVIGGALGVAAGTSWLDSIAGVIIAVIVVRHLWRSAQQMTTRLIDGVEEDLTWRIARAAEDAGAANVADVRARWSGHRLHAEITIGVPPDTAMAAARPLAAKIRAGVAAKLPQVRRVAVIVVATDEPSA
jgi:cation diffusion facilitator family transporter